MLTVVRILDRVRLDTKTYRIIPSNFPPIALFEKCADPSDLDFLFALESLTNDRIREEVGQLHMVKPEDRLSGDGTSVIMASFTHFGMPSRFTNGDYGVYYAGLSLEAAIGETKYWQERQLLEMNPGIPFSRDMRVYAANLNDKVGDCIDLRANAEAHDPNDYSYSQHVGAQHRRNGEYGVLYQSVRVPGELCVACFRPPIIKAPAVQSRHLKYSWDGRSITVNEA